MHHFQRWGYHDGMEITFTDDTPPSDVVVSNNPTTDLSCINCGTALTYGGRGRKPKYCANCKPTASSGSTSTRAPRANSIDMLVSNISDFYRTIGIGLTIYPPTSYDGLVVAESADKLGESWRKLLESNPKVRKYWEKAFTAGSYGFLVSAHLGVLIPILQHHGIGPAMPGFPTATPTPTDESSS